MVAAWISADTGVGPSIASSTQDCSGTCADFPHAPSSSSSPSAVATPLPPERTEPKTPLNCTLPNSLNIRKMARARPASPIRLTMNAFFAATAAEGLKDRLEVEQVSQESVPFGVGLAVVRGVSEQFLGLDLHRLADRLQAPRALPGDLGPGRSGDQDPL